MPQLPLLWMLAVVCVFAGCNDENSTGGPTPPKPAASADGGPQNLASATIAAVAKARYVNDQSCRDCHVEIFESYQHVAMAHSFYDFASTPTIETFDAVDNQNHYFHPPSGFHYEMEVEDGKMRMSRYQLDEKGQPTNHHSQMVDYVMGSGQHVRTYLYRNESGALFQLPVVWYSQTEKWGMAPGYDRPDHPDFSRPITRQCMFCHNAYPDYEVDSDVFGKAHRFPKSLPQGIGCQRCHGPGSEHIRVAEEADLDLPESQLQIRKSIVNSAHLSPQLQDDVCNQCHLQPMSQRTSFVRRPGRKDFSYLPGQRLDEYMIHFEPDRNNQLADHFEINHHPYRLAQSRCFTETSGGIRCTQCHDPHKKIPAEQQADYYRNKCFTCHESQDCLDTERGHRADADCIHCHMPERRTTDVVHVTMTDHKISRPSPEVDLTAPRNEIDVPIDMPVRPYGFGEQRTPIDKDKWLELLARALDDDDSAIPELNDLVHERSSGPLEPRLQLAEKLLGQGQYEEAESVLVQLPSANELPIYWIHRGVSNIGMSTFDKAIEYINQAISLDPENAAAWYNLGIAQSRLGQSEKAMTSLRRAISLRPGYVKARNKLGRLLALDDRYDEARTQFESVLKWEPRNIEAYQKLSAVLRRTEKWKLATECLIAAIQIDAQNLDLLKDFLLTVFDTDNRVEPYIDDARSAAAAWVQLSKKNQEAIILQAMLYIQTGSPREGLILVSENLTDDARKVESGLVIAVAQQSLGSLEAAQKNYEGARRALAAIPNDRLTRIVAEFARRAFEEAP